MTERVVPARGSAASTLGPAGLAVLLARLTGIADEMGAALRRAAFSPNIKERADVIVNDPFAGGTHLNDITLVTRNTLDFEVSLGDIINPWAADEA